MLLCPSIERPCWLESRVLPRAAVTHHFRPGPVSPDGLNFLERPDMHVVVWKLPLFRYYQLVRKLLMSLWVRPAQIHFGAIS